MWWRAKSNKKTNIKTNDEINTSEIVNRPCVAGAVLQTPSIIFYTISNWIYLRVEHYMIDSRFKW